LLGLSRTLDLRSDAVATDASAKNGNFKTNDFHHDNGNKHKKGHSSQSQSHSPTSSKKTTFANEVEDIAEKEREREREREKLRQQQQQQQKQHPSKKDHEHSKQNNDHGHSNNRRRSLAKEQSQSQSQSQLPLDGFNDVSDLSANATPWQPFSSGTGMGTGPSPGQAATAAMEAPNDDADNHYNQETNDKNNNAVGDTVKATSKNDKTANTKGRGKGGGNKKGKEKNKLCNDNSEKHGKTSNPTATSSSPTSANLTLQAIQQAKSKNTRSKRGRGSSSDGNHDNNASISKHNANNNDNEDSGKATEKAYSKHGNISEKRDGGKGNNKGKKANNIDNNDDGKEGKSGKNAKVGKDHEKQKKAKDADKQSQQQQQKQSQQQSQQQERNTGGKNSKLEKPQHNKNHDKLQQPPKNADKSPQPKSQTKPDKPQSSEKSKDKKQSKPEKSSPANKPSIPPNQPQTTNDLRYASGRPITVLHIAEKPSIAQSIANGLTSTSNGSSSSKSSSRGSLPTYEFTDPPFPKAPHASKTTHRVTSVAGHVFNVDFPTEFQSWDSVDPAELFHAPVVRKPCKGSIVRHLQDVARGCDFIVLWLDCDREGENISFEVLECCMHLMASSSSSSSSGQYDRVYRAYFSAINPTDIKKAYHALGKPDKNQSLSVDARQELDLKVGVAFSRFQTRYFQGRYGDLDSAVLSYGPCQTPTLGFCVQRHVEMETFKPEPYWLLDLGIMNAGTMCRAVWDSGRSFNRNKVDDLVAKCRNATPAASAKVLSVVSKDKKQGRPVPLNTVALLKACSKALGIGPHAALSVAERLYLSGYLSYPRTESTSYPKSYDIIGTLQDQTHDSRWGQYVQDLLKTGINSAKGGVDMGDHPPITPCRHARAGELSGDMARVYDLVARHFIASVSHDAVWRSTTVRLAIEELGEKGNFTIRGKQLVSPGFLSIVLYKQYGDEAEEGTVDDDDEEEEKNLPEFKEGELYSLFFPASKKSDKVSVTPAGGKYSTLDVKERMTTPPTYLTESELISKMEKHGIGTDASISTHIENILKRNYVELIPGRKLKPSRLGLVLAQGYHLIDNSLVLPKIRSDIENECNLIAKGIATKEDVVKKAIELFSNKFKYFVENINKMDVLFGSSFAQLQDVGKPFTRCGSTRRYLQYITGPPPRLYNKTTETVYPLPIGGEIKQWTGRNCPVCNFELCLYSVGAPPRTFPLCPYCFNNPKPEWGAIPGEDNEVASGDADDEAKERNIRRLAGKNLIRECPHSDKHPLIEEMTVSPDPESDGVLILDPHLGPKWRLVSTRDPTIVYLPKSVDKVTILDKTDEVLGCHLMSIEFKDGESPIDGKKKHISCFASDELLQGLVRVHHGDERLKASSGGRGGGRGRGGRGRGRGGGRGGRGGERGGKRR